MQQPVNDQTQPSAEVQSAESFRGFERAFKGAEIQKRQDLQNEAAEHQHEQVEEMIKTTITDADWDDLIHKAQKARQKWREAVSVAALSQRSLHG